MAHPAAALFAFLGNRLRTICSNAKQPASDGSSPPLATVERDTERDRLPPRDESFYWAWQYWSH